MLIILNFSTFLRKRKNEIDYSVQTYSLDYDSKLNS